MPFILLYTQWLLIFHCYLNEICILPRKHGIVSGVSHSLDIIVKARQREYQWKFGRTLCGRVRILAANSRLA